MSRAKREVSPNALTTGVPLGVSGPRAKKRSFLIEILLPEGRLEGACSGADKFWQRGNDALWQETVNAPQAGAKLEVEGRMEQGGKGQVQRAHAGSVPGPCAQRGALRLSPFLTCSYSASNDFRVAYCSPAPAANSPVSSSRRRVDGSEERRRGCESGPRRSSRIWAVRPRTPCLSSK